MPSCTAAVRSLPCCDCTAWLVFIYLAPPVADTSRIDAVATAGVALPSVAAAATRAVAIVKPLVDAEDADVKAFADALREAEAEFEAEFEAEIEATKIAVTDAEAVKPAPVVGGRGAADASVAGRATRGGGEARLRRGQRWRQRQRRQRQRWERPVRCGQGRQGG